MWQLGAQVPRMAYGLSGEVVEQEVTRGGGPLISAIVVEVR